MISRQKLRFGCWTTAIFLGFAPSTFAQGLRITAAALTNGSVQIGFPGRSDSYYFLHSGSSITSTSPPVAALLGQDAQQAFQSSVSASSRFFKVEQIATNSPYNYLGDGIPDGWKLLNHLNPLDPAVATNGPPGDTRTWYQIYTNNLALAQPPIAYFADPSSTVIAGSPRADVPILFTKPFTGRVTYHLSGTAIASVSSMVSQSGDYFQPLGYLDVTNSTTALISIQLAQRHAVENNSSILIALSVVPGATNQVYTIAANTSLHTVQIAQSLQGVYEGVLFMTNGLIIGPQPVKMAIRPDDGGKAVAFFDVTGNPLLGDNFSVPVSYDADGFQLTGGFSRQLTNSPFGRALTLTASLGSTQTNGFGFSVPVAITVNGLTASGIPYTGSGYLTLNRSH